MFNKISIFIPSFESGGVENNVILYSDILIKNNIDTEVVYVRATSNLDNVDNNVKKIKIGKKLSIPFIHPRVLDSISLLKDYYTYLKKNEVLVLSFQNSIIAIILAKLTKRKIIVRVASHPNAAKKEKSLVVKISQKLKKFIYKYSDLIITNSNVTALALKKEFKTDVKVIYNPSFNKRIIANSQEKVNLNIKGKKIISVGRLSYEKDFKTLIKAFKIVKEQIKDSNLIIVGDGNERKNLENLVKELDLSDVYFLGYQSNPHKYIASSDLFVLSSLYEGLPNVLIEAIAIGIPAISTNCLSGPSEILLDGKGGDLVEVGDEKEMAKSIIKNLQDKNYAKAKWEVAYKNLNRFSYEVVEKKILEMINNV